MVYHGPKETSLAATEARALVDDQTGHRLATPLSENASLLVGQAIAMRAKHVSNKRQQANGGIVV